jgi:hypothetical protein
MEFWRRSHRERLISWPQWVKLLSQFSHKCERFLLGNELLTGGKRPFIASTRVREFRRWGSSRRSATCSSCVAGSRRAAPRRQRCDQFLEAGGKFIAPTDDDLRAFVALAAMDARKLPGFDAWLRQQQPLFKTRLFQEASLCPPPFHAPKLSAAPGALPPSPQDKSPPAGAKPLGSKRSELGKPQDRASNSPTGDLNHAV